MTLKQKSEKTILFEVATLGLREIGEMQLSLSYQKSFDEILTSQ